jgi:Ca-activated chloride channel family protein
LRRAKLLLEKLVDRLDNDKVGLVVFAGEAKTKMPMTTDFYSAKMFINELEPSMILAQGTSISDALEMSINSFSQKEDVHKAIILITDAEDHEGQAVETAKEAAKKGIQVDVIGVGTSKGARIPLGKGSKSFMTDNEGNEVITAVDEKAAAEIAAAGKGIYVNGANPNALDKLSEQLEKLGKTELKNVSYKISAEQFPVFAWLALILLIADLLVIERKISWLKNVNFFSKNTKKPTEK